MKLDWKNCIRAGVTAFCLFLCIYYWKTFTHLVGLGFQAATPLFMGCVIAYIVNILMSFYEAHYFPKSQSAAVKKSKRPVCMLGAFVTLFLILVLVMGLVVPELVSCVRLLFAGIPDVMESLSDGLAGSGLLNESFAELLQDVDWNSVLMRVLNVLKSWIDSTLNFAVGALSSAASVLVNLVIGTIFSIYLLIGKERLLGQCNRVLARYVKPAWNEKLHYVLHIVNECFHSYIVGQCTEAVILGALCAVGMLLFGFPYAVMTGAVIGVTALIPVAGAYIGGAVGFLLILSVAPPAKALLFLVYLVVLQQLEGNLIYPRVVGASIGLPGLWVLATVTVGGSICGIAGMLLGVPLAAAAYQLLRNDMNRKKQGSNFSKM